MSEKRADREARIKRWAEALTPEQSTTLLIELVEVAIDADVVRFWSDSLAPYWESNGEPLVEGQKAFPDED